VCQNCSPLKCQNGRFWHESTGEISGFDYKIVINFVYGNFPARISEWLKDLKLWIWKNFSSSILSFYKFNCIRKINVKIISEKDCSPRRIKEKKWDVNLNLLCKSDGQFVIMKHKYLLLSLKAKVKQTSSSLTKLWRYFLCV